MGLEYGNRSRAEATCAAELWSRIGKSLPHCTLILFDELRGETVNCIATEKKSGATGLPCSLSNRASKIEKIAKRLRLRRLRCSGTRIKFHMRQTTTHLLRVCLVHFSSTSLNRTWVRNHLRQKPSYPLRLLSCTNRCDSRSGKNLSL